jgi:hypothetical protein
MLSLNALAFFFHSGSSSNSTNGKTNRIPSRRPLIAPKLRAININERLSSSDSGGSLQHMKKHSNDKSTMTMTDNHVPRNGYGTWNRYR